MSKLIRLSAIIAGLLSASLSAGVLTTATYPVRHPSKTAKVLMFPVKHPVKTYRYIVPQFLQ